MPKLRLQFIFLRRERFLTRAKRIIRNQPEPMLLNSYKAHLKAVTSLDYIHLPKIILSGSHDNSCRLWTLGGRYLGTLGTPLPWTKLSPFGSVNEEKEYRMPPDIKKVASTTTIKVISGVHEDRIKTAYVAMTQEDNMPHVDEEIAKLYGKALKEPILGKHFSLPTPTAVGERIELDTSLSYIPVYTHLKVHDTQNIVRPPTPPIINAISKEEYIDYFNPPNKKETTNDNAASEQLATTKDVKIQIIEKDNNS